MNTIDKAPVKTIPDASGRQVPVNCIRASTVLQHEVAEKIRDHFRELAAFNKAKKEQIFEAMQAYRDLLAQEYGLRSGGTRGGMTIRTYDAHTEIKLEERDYHRTTPEISIAQELVAQIIDDYTERADVGLRELVMRAFETDKKNGRPNVGDILKLKSLNLEHPLWPEAKRALEDSIAVLASKTAVTCRVRPNRDSKHEQLVVDFSRV
ncbi:MULTISPECIES: DUF3164 family protein [unclassified Asaia]|uniref:DUF3164 family protein n=1 Tax=unclassified Asaia TaxID=2685023 RepID=UPI001315AB89|nr:DUF3164 family protein [Asaia sp. W19]